MPIGDGEQPQLQRAMRAHANFAEYVPITLLLLFFVETQAIEDRTIHVLGSALVLGRLVHAYGVSQVQEDYRFRVGGMILTFIALFGATLRLLLRAFAPGVI